MGIVIQPDEQQLTRVNYLYYTVFSHYLGNRNETFLRMRDHYISLNKQDRTLDGFMEWIEEIDEAVWRRVFVEEGNRRVWIM